MEPINDPNIYGEIHETTIPLPSWLDKQTRYSAIVHAMKTNGNKKAMGRRQYLPNGKRGEYIWEDGNTVLKKINQLSLALRALGLKKGDMVGIMSRNRPEWTIADIACSAQGYITVPIYDSYGPASCEYIISSTKQVCIFVASKHIDFIKEACTRCPTVKDIILFDGTPEDEEFINSVDGRNPESRKSLSELGFNHLYSELMETGAKLLEKNGDAPIEDPSIKYDDTCTIVFTSGTQGTPKGAILGHNAVLKGGCSLIGRASNFPEQDFIISYLPLAHIFQRNIEIMSLTHAIGIGYYSGSIPALTEDLYYLHPTLFPVVPRVLTKICSTIHSKVASMNPIARAVFNTAVFLRKKERKDGWPTHFLSDIVLKKISSMFGGKLRITVSGSAPLSRDVGEFLDLVMGGRVLEGYGCTEACGASFAMLEVDNNFGSVGAPHPGVQCRLMSVPEMNYLVTSDPPCGEICLGGDALFKGYFNDPEASAAALKDGWLHTGDIGMWLPDGNLKVIDRLKNVFKLQQGEFVYLDEIERCLSISPLIAQILIYGESSMNGLVAIVVPDRKALITWAEEENLIAHSSSGEPDLSDANFAKVCSLPRANEYVRNHIETQLREQNRKGYEIPRAIHLTPIEFSIENNQLTPTMKTRREVITKAYAAQLEAMSKDLRA